MSESLKRLVLEPTSAIAPANYRTYVAFSVGAISAFFVHLCILPLFWWLGATELLWLNIASELAYIAAFVANRRGHHATMITIAMLELSVHQTCCVHYLGWATGFQYYLLVVPAFVFFLPSGRLPTQIALQVTTTAVFIALMKGSQAWAPVYAIAPSVQSLIACVNVSVVFGLLGFFTHNYHRAAVETEALLAAHERKLSDDRLILLKAAVNAAHDVIVITDKDGTVEFVNPAFTRVTGHPPEAILGNNMRLVKSGVHGRDFYAEFWGTLREGKIWSGRVVNRRKNGELYTERATVAPIQDEHGVIQHYLAIKQDVTESERAADRLLKAEDQLRQARKMEALGTLAGGIAHDFNNLLTAILGGAECAMEALPAGDPVREDLDEIKKAGERAASLTRQLLAYSRKQVLSPHVLDLNRVIRDIEKLLRRSLSERVKLVTKLAPTAPRIEADEAQLGQILHNLAVNANDAMRDGGVFVIETEHASFTEPARVGGSMVPAGDYAVLIVSDTGVGILPELLPNIFDPFFTTKALGHGTGLGLSTVYGIVTQSGGHLAVESQVGIGTSFKLFLPSTTASETSSERPAGAARARGNETVLLVEDDPSVRAVTLRMLKGLGYRVLEASNGPQALELLGAERERVHLLVTDVMMPGLDGPTLAGRAISTHPHLRTLFVSGYPGEVLSKLGSFVTGENFLSKPFSQDALAAVIRRVLDA